MQNREWRIGLLIGIVLTLCVMVIYGLKGFEWLELQSYDLRLSLRGPLPLTNQVLLVTIDEASLQKLGTTLREFKRSILAETINRLAASGTRLIGIDMVLSNPSQDSTADRQLRDAMAQANNVILPRFISSGMSVPPWNFFSDVEMGEGMITVILDKDGALRSMPVLSAEIAEGELTPYLGFSLEIARLFMDPQGEQELDLSQPNEIKIGSMVIPSPDNKLLINFHGPPGHFPALPIWRVLSGEFSPDEVSGKIVLIGAHTPSVYDAYRTPFSGGTRKGLAPWGGEANFAHLDRMYGVEIHANAVQTILEKKFIHRTSHGVVITTMTLLGLVSTAILLFVRRLRWVSISLGFMTALIPLASMIFFVQDNLWVDMIPLMATVMMNYIGGVIYQRYIEAQQKKRITGLFSRYVSTQLVERLIKDPTLLNLGGTKKRLTIFFSDIRGFTTMSEKMDPAEVIILLNEYFKEMTQLVFKYNGTLDKFIGDALLAFFGDPVPYPDHALRAVKMALEMQQVINRLNQKWLSEGRHSIAVGMGINTGVVIVGNMGSEEFVDYTVIGDEVNLACRLEENAKGGQILITQNTYDEIKDQIKVTPLEPILPKGKSKPILVYNVGAENLLPLQHPIASRENLPEISIVAS